MDPATLLGTCTVLTLGPCLPGPSLERGALHLAVGPSVDAGYPTFRAGVHGRIGVGEPLRDGLSVQLDVGLLAGANDLGIPGPRLQTIASLPVGIRLGGIGLAYEPIAYLDTLGTSQLSGALTVSAVRGPNAWSLRVENDYLAFRSRDEWRTAAIETHLLIQGERLRWGVGLETKIWTASTTGLASLDAGQSYDLSGQHGEGWSHGIACVAVTVQSVRVCAGWDSEGIRDVIQNRFHDLIDDGRLPRLQRAGQPYLRISHGALRTSY